MVKNKKSVLKTDVLKKITKHYLESRDFNGILITNLGKDFTRIKNILIELVNEGLVVLNFGDRHPNPHILAFDPEPKEEQMEKLKLLNIEKPIYQNLGPVSMQVNSVSCCAYPSKKYLKEIIDQQKYQGKPFKLLLALGEPQLSYKAFNLKVLENYRNDPRYSYNTDDVYGSISVKSEEALSDSDDTFLETFGFAYDQEIKSRYVAVYLAYLSKMSPKHQQLWNLEMFDSKTFLHPDYARTTDGHWPEKESIFNAFCEEMRIINEMTEKIYGKPIFRQPCDRYNKPNKFSFLVRPTKEEYEGFVHLLDKIVSDNINKNFFEGKVEMKSVVDKNGILVEQNKGTIQLLQEWLDITIKFSDPEPMREMIRIFKRIRKSRSKPAHHVSENHFDDDFFVKQRSLMKDAYKGVRTLRLILSNHPLSKSVEVPDWLYKGDIWTF
jgi:hypothetical protein